ncbi:MAG: hypothetical protein FWG87_05195 [Defluviitaleaceae bacterium]|nr:hypothetical protein [Defluviitaleaceae bacterium]
MHERIRENPWKSAKSVFDLHILASCVCLGVLVGDGFIRPEVRTFVNSGAGNVH